MTIRVEIEHCAENRKTVLNARTDDLDVAVERALKKHGKGNVFLKNHQMSLGYDALSGTQYGQIGRSVRSGGVSVETGMVTIRAEIVN